MIVEPKPLPVGTHRLVRICTCGRVIPPEEVRSFFLSAKPCPECGGRTWVFWRRPVTLWERFRAWLELRRWKNRRSKLYG